MHALAILLFLFWGQQTTSSIGGVVVKSGTSTPIAKVTVAMRRLNAGGPPGQPAVSTTDSDGRFAFIGIAPGRYQIAASRPGYVEGSATSTREVVVEAGNATRNLRLSLNQTGAVSGRVFANTGDPVANVPVQALRYSWSDGQMTLNAVKSAETNDRGEFRLYWLPPGRYYFRANPGGAGTLPMFHSTDGKLVFMSGSERDRNSLTPEPHYAPVYYPGTADPQAALAVDVGSGSDVGGMDFTLVQAATHSVRILVIDEATGLPVSNANLRLAPRNGSELGSSSFTAGSNNVYEARDVLPGAYFLAATARINAGGDSFWVRGGLVRLDVADRDVEATVVVRSPGRIPGRMMIDGDSSALQTRPVVELRTTVRGIPFRPTLYGDFSGSSEFLIDDVLEGEYRVHLTDIPDGMYVKSVRYGGADVLNRAFYVDSRAGAGLEIALGANAGTVDGIVRSPFGNPTGREPMANASVVLVPSIAQSGRQDLAMAARSDPAGRFHFDGIAPGDYLLFAWEDIDEGLWRDPDFIRRNERSGYPVRISEGTRETAELTTIPIQ